MIIYAARDNIVIWSDHQKIHKAGRVPLYEPLIVILEYAVNWFKIERPENLSLPEDPAYPDYWVHREDIVEAVVEPIPDPIPEPDPEPTPEPDPEPEPSPEIISDEAAAEAILLLARWFKQN